MAEGESVVATADRVTPVTMQAFKGLTAADAAARLIAEGGNELPQQESRKLWSIAFEVVREPMFLLLLAAGTLYLLMGETADALMLLGFVFVVLGISITQQWRTEQALNALRVLSSPRALVIRDGVQQKLASRAVVRGDLIVVAEGDRVPADALLRWGGNVSADESLLTGESVACRKQVAPAALAAMERPGGDDLASVYSGTLITSGQGVAEVVATGPRTELGKIGNALVGVTAPATHLQQETQRLVRLFALVGVAACVLVVVMYALTRGGSAMVWKQGLLAGIAMAMAVLPEEFPVVLTVFLALGAWRISRQQVLARRMPAVEMLGAATVLCVDKTGTLTQNQMTLRVLADAGHELVLPALVTTTPGSVDAPLGEVLITTLRASKTEPFDAMERALVNAGQQLCAEAVAPPATWTLVRAYDLDPGCLAVSQVWRIADTTALYVASKGAPETIARLCGLDGELHAAMAAQVAALAARGLRVLGVAQGRVDAAALPEQQAALKLHYLGLVAFEDPLRASVPQAVHECHTAGVRVVMITGDNPTTALSIARQAGLAEPLEVATGVELDALSDEQLQQRVRRVGIFARVVPMQKLRIVNAFKANGDVVAMTGDGVNDAPALKAAHIGIAMGGRGTDVAREAAALVLLDDDFASIVGAIKLGRRIFGNLQKAVAFILAVHVPIAGLSMLPVFFASWPLLLFPIHIVFLELIIDPSCTLIFESEAADPDVMQRPPRAANARLFAARTVKFALLQGLGVLAVCVSVFLLARRDHGVDAARALTFATMVIGSLAIIMVNRSWTQSVWAMRRVPNAPLRYVVLGTFVLLGLVLFVPAIQRLAHFAPLHATDLALAIGAGVVSVLWFELVKRLGRVGKPAA